MASTPLSAPRITSTDAIGPAFKHTFTLLAKPFSLGRFLKQTILAGFAEPSYFAVILGIPMQIIQLMVMSRMPQHGGTQNLPNTSIHPQVFMGIFAAVIGIFGLGLMTVLLYFFCRLRFVVMDWVLFGHSSVREGWRKYGTPSWRYFGLTLLLSIGVLLLVTVVAGPMVPWAMRIAQNIDPSQPESMAKFFSMFFFPYMAIMMGLGVLLQVLDGVVRDFFLPPMGLSDAPIEGCFQRFFQLFRNEPGDTTLYVILRTVLGWVFQSAAVIVIVIPTLFLAGIALLLGAALHHALWSTGSGGQLLFVAYVVVAVLIWLAFYLTGIFAAMGCGGFFKQTYAITWLATRYPELTAIVYGTQAPVEPATSPETALPPTPPPDIAPPILG